MKSVNQKPATDVSEQAARATISGYGLAKLALGATVLLGLLGPLMSLPRVSKAIDDKIPGAVTWATATWSWPWLLLLAALSASFGIGILVGRRAAARDWHKTSTSPASTTSTPPATKDSEPPVPSELPEIDRRILGLLAAANRLLPDHLIANHVGVRAVTARAALNRLEALSIAYQSGDHFALSRKGIAYVDKHHDELFGQAGRDLGDDEEASY